MIELCPIMSRLKSGIWQNFEPISAKFLPEMGSKFFGGLNQKSESISFSGIQSSNSCKRNHGKILIVAEVIRRLVTDT